MPRIWIQTIEAHRDAVREATLDAAAAMVAEHGLAGVTMSQIAKDTGIGRATLYKYFPDVDSILRAWHEPRIDEHLKQLLHIRDQTDVATQRLEAVLTAYTAAISHRREHGSDLAAALHHGEHVAAAHQHLRAFIQELDVPEPRLPGRDPRARHLAASLP
jgi:AcrR family transcriptional regulator